MTLQACDDDSLELPIASGRSWNFFGGGSKKEEFWPKIHNIFKGIILTWGWNEQDFFSSAKGLLSSSISTLYFLKSYTIFDKLSSDAMISFEYGHFLAKNIFLCKGQLISE